jgi:RNA polymerase sigma factor (sigma-70 family)
MRAPLLFFNEDSKLLDALRNGDDEALVELYEKNRRAVSSLVGRNQGTEDDIEDVLQEAIIVLWERVRSGRFEHNAKLSTFLYAIAKNIWFRRLARRRKEVCVASDMVETASSDPIPIEELEDNERVRAVQTAMEQIGNPCRDILLLYYWEERSMEEIAAKLGFANSDTVKSKKYQCKKILERLVKNTLGGASQQ